MLEIGRQKDDINEWMVWKGDEERKKEE